MAGPHEGAIRPSCGLPGLIDSIASIIPAIRQSRRDDVGARATPRKAGHSAQDAASCGFEPDEARALALLLLSWRRESFPPRYLPAPRTVAAAGEPKAARQPAAVPQVASAEAGRDVFVTRGCNSCHGVGTGTVIGPDLKGVGTRRTPEWLRSLLADPAATIRASAELQSWPAAYGNIVMPNQNLSTQQIEALVRYLEGI